MIRRQFDRHGAFKLRAFFLRTPGLKMTPDPLSHVQTMIRRIRPFRVDNFIGENGTSLIGDLGPINFGLGIVSPD